MTSNGIGNDPNCINDEQPDDETVADALGFELTDSDGQSDSAPQAGSADSVTMGHQTSAVAQLLQYLIATVDSLDQRIDQLEEENQQLRERNAEQDERIDDLEETTEKHADGLTEYREHNERDKASIRQRVNEIEEDQSGSDSDTTQNENRTPIERISLLGAEDTGIHVTQSVERAVTIYENFDQWAHRTPKGLVLKDGLRTLLQTARDEPLAWKQVNRAADALEELSKGAIEFKKHRRHGNILVKEDDPTGCQSSSALG